MVKNTFRTLHERMWRLILMPWNLLENESQSFKSSRNTGIYRNGTRYSKHFTFLFYSVIKQTAVKFVCTHASYIQMNIHFYTYVRVRSYVSCLEMRRIFYFIRWGLIPVLRYKRNQKKRKTRVSVRYEVPVFQSKQKVNNWSNPYRTSTVLVPYFIKNYCSYRTVFCSTDTISQ